jgi:hypothetical protein
MPEGSSGMNLTRADYLRAKIAKAQKELDTLAAPSSVDGPSVLVAVPTHSGDLKHRTVLSLISTLDKFRSNGVRYELEIIPGCAYVQLVRNVFANRAAFDLNRSGRPYSHLLFIDADGAFSADDVLTLLKADKPIAALPFSAKFIDWNGVAKAVRAGVAPAHLVEYAGSPILSGESFPVNSLSTVARIGTGVMLIEVRVLKALAESHPEWRFKNDKFGWGIASNLNREHAYEFFKVGICPETENMVGEDFFFCNEARKLGFETWVLPNARTVHTGSADYVCNMPALASLGNAPEQPKGAA